MVESWGRARSAPLERHRRDGRSARQRRQSTLAEIGSQRAERSYLEYVTFLGTTRNQSCSEAHHRPPGTTENQNFKRLKELRGPVVGPRGPS